MQNVRILIAGEKSTAFPVLARILGRASETYELVAQTCGAFETLQLLQDNRIDIVLLDASGMEGMDLCRRITTHYPRIRVVLVGGRRDYGCLKQAMDACARGYVAEDECTGERIRMEIERVMQTGYEDSEIKKVCEELDSTSGSFAVARAIEFIRHNYKRNISFSEAAEYAGISESHLRRCFKRKTGKSFVDFLTDFRLNVAKTLMAHENWSISRISEESGFSSARYFCRVFKTATNKTPRDYMQELAKKKNQGGRF